MFDEYLTILKKWNRVHNLTRMGERELQEAIEDSIYPLQFVQFSSLLDIGSGAGFPAIPIAIQNPNSQIILVEPIKKRSSFLNFVKSELNLKNVKIYSDRVENLKIDEVDLITSRAVAETENLIKLSQHLLKKGGKFLFFKGSNVENEIQNIPHPYEIVNRGNRNYLIVGV